jgi:hypothetical protein
MSQLNDFQPIEKRPLNPEEIKQHIESVPSPEQQFETREQEPMQIETKSEGFLEEAISGLKKKLRSSKKKPTAVPIVRDALTMEVEKVMEDGLKDAFKELTPIQRQEFKIRGEQTATQIRDLLRATHVKIKKIIRLLIEWLKMLPGINRFFLEQEAKIKADKIVALKKLDNKNF